MLQLFKKIILFIGFFCLVSCGFHLRGQIPLAPPLKRLYLQTKDPYAELAKNLRQYLKMSGVYLADNANNATTILDILSESEGEQLQSVSGTQQTRQYKLTLTVTFQITDPAGNPLTPPQIVNETRPLTIQANQILGGSNEAESLYRQMHQSIVFNIMNRLSSKDITKILENYEKKHH